MANVDNLSDDQLRFLLLLKVLSGEISESSLPKPIADVVNAYKVVYAIDKELWPITKQSLLASKESFDATLMGLLKGNEHGKVVFMLPDSVTKAERHTIHTFSKKGLNSAKSEDINGKRIMKIVLEATFIVKNKK